MAAAELRRGLPERVSLEAHRGGFVKTALCFTACRKRWDAYGAPSHVASRSDGNSQLHSGNENGTIHTKCTDLNCMQVYRVYKQRQVIEQFFRTYGASLDFETSYMRTQVTQEA